MKVGDTVIHKDYPEYGKGRIVAFQLKMATVLVKFENFKTCTYHIPWALVKQQLTSVIREWVNDR